MATLVESAEMETLAAQSNTTGASPTSSSPSQHFNDSKFYLLVVIGEIISEDHLKCAIADIEKGEVELMTLHLSPSVCFAGLYAQRKILRCKDPHPLLFGFNFTIILLNISAHHLIESGQFASVGFPLYPSRPGCCHPHIGDS